MCKAQIAVGKLREGERSVLCESSHGGPRVLCGIKQILEHLEHAAPLLKQNDVAKLSRAVRPRATLSQWERFKEICLKLGFDPHRSPR